MAVIKKALRLWAQGTNYFLGKHLRKNNLIIANSLDFLGRQRKIDPNYLDYIRLATLELVSEEIRTKNLAGNVAELGVYKGKFARYLNAYFPDRRLYLFDTFEGFHERDIKSEKKNQFSGGEQDFSDTSVEQVLSRMPHPQNCKAVKGFFPESAKGIEDDFVFVSLDADLYDPILAGLVFFYPRLVRGGYIFVHDFNNAGYKGTRRAVEEFCARQSIGFVPLPDSGGSVIIAK